ncbi:hypothetical protein B0H66DRAFT_80833 [Apodospora peruviana]|uniref:Transmembrane protein n=1 Tax=Apodospora peruviana TaxID=516989 RepID=A0AAE0ITC2_9PEZI|nr:hypothetical protein B0H66DRAFT_80833 [Apodospora peruviana]
MKATNFYLALSVAPFAICAPVPISGGAAHPPATVPSTRPRHALPRFIHFGPDVDDDDGIPEVEIDNRAYTPSATEDPTEVLASRRPLVTEYLMALSEEKEEAVEHSPTPATKASAWSRWNRKYGSAAATSQQQLSTGQHENDFISIAEMEVIVPAVQYRRPCHTYLPKEYNDMMVILLAVVFLLVVVSVETWGTLSHRLSCSLRQEGVIRLDGEKDSTVITSQKGTLSIQADPETLALLAKGESSSLGR